MKVFWSQRAGERVSEITGWIDERDPMAAARFLTKLSSSASLLADNPELGQVNPLRPQFRRLRVDDFILEYRVVLGEVRIRTVYHGHYEPPLDDFTDLDLLG